MLQKEAEIKLKKQRSRVQKVSAESIATRNLIATNEDAYNSALLVCCCSLRYVQFITALLIGRHSPLSMFTKPDMLVYQAKLNKHYKPPSLNMLERRLSELVRGGLPVGFLLAWSLRCAERNAENVCRRRGCVFVRVGCLVV